MGDHEGFCKEVVIQVIMESIKIGIYTHYKTGKKYRVIGIAKHSETLEDLIVYEALY